MLSATAYVPWQPTGQHDIVVPHPTEVCEPINLAATTQPELVYEMLTSGRGLSTMQTETIQLIMQSFAARGSFLLGDATGVGKGRTIAGLIAEITRRYPRARVSWVTATVQLLADAKNEYAAVDSDSEFERVVHFTSYTALTSTPRANALVDWLSDADSDSMTVLILDECHALRNVRSIAAQMIEHTIQAVKSSKVNLKILYSSATACSTPKHIGYLGRLGLFGTHETPFADFAELSKALRTHGSSLMELLAIDLRSRGAYVSRQLSFANVHVSNCVVELNAAQRSMYNACVEALSADATPLRGSAHQSFFQRIVTGLKVEQTIVEAERHVALGSSVVISLVNTGEASLRRMLRDPEYHSSSLRPQQVSDDALSEMGVVVDNMPLNPLDSIVEHFGVGSIAELTGRRHRLVRQKNGGYALEKNPPLRSQVSDFQSGRKHVAVLSRAGGIGISLHDAEDGRPRVHIILELPWSAEDILQQMGRTHRSSSLHSPSYVLMTSDVPAEMRFASAIVNKLQSFGALVKADRRSCSFGFFKVPRWNISERRSINLYLAVAKVYNETESIVSLSRHQALTVCAAGRHESDAHIKDRLVRLVQNESSERMHTLVGVAQCLYPRDVTMLLRRWHPDCHHLFPSAFKGQVLTMLLCAQAWETSNTLGMLTQDLLFSIVEHIACPVSLPQARMVAHEFGRVGLDDISQISLDIILNRMLGMPLEAQRCVFDIADALVVPETPPPNNCLLRYASGRAGSCVDAVIADISYTSFDSITRGVSVDVVYGVRTPPSPHEGGRVWRHQKSGRICWVDEPTHRIIFTDGTEVRLTTVDRSTMRFRDYFECSLQHWNEAVARNRLYAGRRLHRLPRRFLLATTHSMRKWESSAQRVLRVPPTASFPHGIVGLLMSARC